MSTSRHVSTCRCGRTPPRREDLPLRGRKGRSALHGPLRMAASVQKLRPAAFVAHPRRQHARSTDAGHGCDGSIAYGGRASSRRMSAVISGSTVVEIPKNAAQIVLGSRQRFARQRAPFELQATGCRIAAEFSATLEWSTRAAIRCRAVDAGAVPAAGGHRSSSAASTRPIRRIASRPSAGRLPCAARPCITISAAENPLWATPTSRSVGSGMTA